MLYLTEDFGFYFSNSVSYFGQKRETQSFLTGTRRIFVKQIKVFMHYLIADFLSHSRLQPFWRHTLYASR